MTASLICFIISVSPILFINKLHTVIYYINYNNNNDDDAIKTIDFACDFAFAFFLLLISKNAFLVFISNELYK